MITATIHDPHQKNPHKKFNKPFIKCISYVGQYSYEVYLAHIFPVAFFIPLKLTDSMLLIVAVTIASTVVLTIFYAYLQKMFLIRFTQSWDPLQKSNMRIMLIEI